MGHRFVGGYVCAPDGHNERSEYLQKRWLDSSYVHNLYFVTATFSNGGRSFFPNHSNHCIFASFSDPEMVMQDLSRNPSDYPAFLFSTKNSLFERPSMSELNFVSINFIKQVCGREEICDLEDLFLRRRERIRAADFGNMQVIPKKSLKFAFPYSENLVILQLESEKSHQSDQKYCERTRSEVIRKGIDIDNLVSFSILSKLK